MLDEFADAVDAQAVHVASPTNFVFLCGGQGSNIDEKDPKSLRDAFYKISDFKPLSGSTLTRAEDIEYIHIQRARYPDLLSFETDLAQISKLVIIFSEIFGSSAELGAFSMINEITKRMLVVIRNKHYEESSFIKLGAIDYLKYNYSDYSVFVVDDKNISITSNKPTFDTIEKLKMVLDDPVTKRLNEIENPSTFDTSNNGHIIKLIVGLVQEFGDLTVNEIETLLIAFELNKNNDEIMRYILCAETAGWVVNKRKGFRDFTAAKNLPKDAANFKFKSDKIEKTAMRRRENRRSFYRNNDNDRFLAILDGLGY